MTVASTVCSSCRAPITWAITSNDRRIPIEPLPDPAGNLAVHRDGEGTLRARLLRDGGQPEPHEKRAMPHHANCPYADQHRKAPQ